MSLHFKDLKTGDIVYEDACGSLEVLVISDPTSSMVDFGDGEARRQWMFLGMVPSAAGGSSVVEFLTTEGWEHYGPRLYREPNMVPVYYLPEGDKRAWQVDHDEGAQRLG